MLIHHYKVDRFQSCLQMHAHREECLIVSEYERYYHSYRKVSTHVDFVSCSAIGQIERDRSISANICTGTAVQIGLVIGLYD